MKKRLAFVLSAFCILHSAFAAAATRPDLIVVVSIDQFRYDYLDRFGPWFSERGFNRFLKNGANFSNAYYRHANTFTGPGHASTVSQALDEAGWPEWVGSIAGENTVFVAARSARDGKKLELRLRELLK